MKIWEKLTEKFSVKLLLKITLVFTEPGNTDLVAPSH